MELKPCPAGTCRTCGQSAPEPRSIFGFFEGRIIATIITECTAVQIFEDDELPQQICDDCFKELNNFVKFIQKTRDADRSLRELYKKPVVKVEDVEVTEDVKPGTFLKVEIEDYHEDAVFSDASSGLDYEDKSLDSPKPKRRGRKPKVKQQDSDEEPLAKRRGRKRKPKSESESESDSSSSSEYSNEEDSDSEEDDNDKPLRPKEKGKRGRKKMLRPPPPPDEMDEMEMEVFIVVPVTPDEFLCCKCFKLFTTLPELESHGKTHASCLKPDNGKKSNFCKICYRRYSTVRAVKSHRTNIQELDRVFECKICQFRCAQPMRRKTHAHNHKKVPIVPEELKKELGVLCCAKNCEKSFPTQEALLEHGQTDHKHNKIEANLGLCNIDRPFQCQVCFSCFYSESGLEKHGVRKYRPKRHQCAICGEKFAFPADLELHERIHRNERNFPCDICPKKFYTETQLKQHLRRHAKKWNFVCNLCGKAFKQKAALQAHMLAHEGKLPFVCEVCNKAFRVKTKMVYHMRTHTGERPYPCRHCDSAFADHTNRMRHELIHFKEKNRLPPPRE
ncbi:hypothetical protein quinque_011655 [Culex quinquefasciatus]